MNKIFSNQKVIAPIAIEKGTGQDFYPSNIDILNDLSDVSTIAPEKGDVLMYNGGVWSNSKALTDLLKAIENGEIGGGGGTADSVNWSDVVGRPTDARLAQWDEAYRWGNHSLAGYASSSVLNEHTSNNNIHKTTSDKNILDKLSVDANGNIVCTTSILAKGDLIALQLEESAANNQIYASKIHTHPDLASVEWVTEQLSNIGGGGGGGVADSIAWSNIFGKPYWITDTKPTYTAEDVGALTKKDADAAYQPKGSYITSLSGYATESWVTNKGYITSSALSPYALTTSLNAHTSATDIHVTAAQKTSWNNKWSWDANAIAAVKVNNSVNSDKLGGQLPSYYATSSALSTHAGDNNLHTTSSDKSVLSKLSVDSNGNLVCSSSILSKGDVLALQLEESTANNQIYAAKIHAHPDLASVEWVNEQLSNLGNIGGGGGGVADSVAWANIFGKPNWITDTKPSYTAEDVGALTKKEADTTYQPKGNYITSLSGYATEAWVNNKGYALNSSLTAHTGDNNIHFTSAERTKLSGIETGANKYTHPAQVATGAGTLGHITTAERANFNSAYGWGNHASAGYASATSLSSHTGNSDIHVTAAQKTAWSNKWDWNEATIKAVKVNNAINSDKLGNQLPSYYATSSALSNHTGNSTIHTTSAEKNVLSKLSLDSNGNLVCASSFLSKGDVLSHQLDESTANNQVYAAKVHTHPDLASITWVEQRINEIPSGGGVADSVAWANVTGKPSWIGSSKPSYTAAEVGALTKTNADTYYQPKGSYITSLSGYATEAWVNNKGYALNSALTSHTGNSDIHFTAAERTKLNGIASSANNYVHPALVATGVGTSGHITTAERNAWNNKWDYNANTIKAVKVDNATNSDKLNGQLPSYYTAKSDFNTHTGDTSIHTNTADKNVLSKLSVDVNGNIKAANSVTIGDKLYLPAKYTGTAQEEGQIIFSGYDNDAGGYDRGYIGMYQSSKDVSTMEFVQKDDDNGTTWNFSINDWDKSKQVCHQMTANTLYVNKSNKFGTGLLDVNGQIRTSTSSSTPPFVVNSTAKVVNLNSDYIDNRSSSEFEGYFKYVANLSSLDGSKYYPVTIKVSGSRMCKIAIVSTLDGATTKPTWGSHKNGFSLVLKWEVIGSDWGAHSTVLRTIEDYTFRYITDYISPVGGINQMTNSSNEVVWLRGGASYNIYLSQERTVTVRTSNFTDAEQTVDVRNISNPFNNVYSSATAGAAYGQVLSTGDVVAYYVGEKQTLESVVYDGFDCEDDNVSLSAKAGKMLMEEINTLRDEIEFLKTFIKEQYDTRQQQY